MARRILTTGAAVVAVLFSSNAGHSDDLVAPVSFACLEAQPALVMADVDARAGRTVQDILVAMGPYFSTHMCVRLPGVPMSHIETILEYKDADGEASEVWRGRLPGAARDVYSVVFVSGEGA